jgi:alkaline phosphatase D
MNRRDLLVGTGLLGMTAISSVSRTASTRISSGKIKEFPFTLGVASGDPWPDGFVIWTRLAPRPFERYFGLDPVSVTVEWEVAADPAFRRDRVTGIAMAKPELGHSVHVEMTGLKPATRYWYRFTAAGHRSATGTVVTAPALMSDVANLRIGVAGCQNYEHGFYTAYRYMAEAQLDAIFHYGDYIYEAKQGRRTEVPVVREHIGEEPTDLVGYRLRYALYKSDPDLQAAHASTAFLTTFDDHELDNNWANDRDENGSDPTVFMLRRAAAMQAWYENMPVRAAQKPIAANLLMHRRLDFGKLLRVHLLDTRQYRDDQVCTSPKAQHCRSIETLQTGSIMGDTQHRWLEEGLDNRYAWNLMAQQVVVMPFRRPGGPTDDAHVAADSWSGYPESRRRLVQAIRRKNISEAIIATGDVHQNIVGYVPELDEEPDRNQAAIEFVCTSISSLGDGKDMKIRGPDFRKIIASNPNVLFANGQRGYHVFEINDRSWTTHIYKVDRVSRPGGLLSRLAGFTVEKGAPLAISS